MTIDEIKRKIAFAAKVLRSLPDKEQHGFISSWPQVLYSPEELLEQEVFYKPYRPTPAEISEMERILEWFSFLNALETKIVWRRANNVPWKIIGEEVGYHRSKLDEKYRVALAKIQAATMHKLCQLERGAPAGIK